MMREDVGQLMTSGEAAAVLGVSAQSVTDWRRGGRLPAIRTALGYLFRLEDVERLRAERAGLPRRHGRVVVAERA